MDNDKNSIFLNENILNSSSIELQNAILKALNPTHSQKSDDFIDIKRLSDIFTIKNNEVLVKNHKTFQKNLQLYLHCKGEPVYRSAKNILLTYKYTMMTNKQRTRLTKFFFSYRYFDRYVQFSYEFGLSVKTLKNFSGYIGTERWKCNIIACLQLRDNINCKRYYY